MKTRPTSLRLILASSIAALFAGQSAQAAAYNWIGATAGAWNTGGNWSGSLVPTITDDLTILGPANVAGALTIDFDADNAAKSLNFTNTALSSVLNSTSGADKTLTLGSGGITTGAGAVQLGGNVANQGVNLLLNSAQTWSIGAGGMTVANVIGGLGTGITKTGTGTLTINTGVVNTFTGGLTINRGTVTLDYANLATPTNLINSGNALTLGGGALTLTGKSTDTTSQTFANATVSAGQNTINISRNGASGSATLNLGALTVNPGGVMTISPATTWGTTASTTEIVKISAGGSVPTLPTGATTAFANAGVFHRVSGGAVGTLRVAAVNSSGQLLLKANAGNLATTTGVDPTGYYQLNAGSIALTNTAASVYGLLLNATSSGVSITVANNGTFTLNSVIQIKSTESVTIAPGTGTSNVVIGSEKNLVLAMDNAAAFGISAPIANNGSTGGTGGTASSVTIAGTAPTGTPGAVTLSGANTYSGGTFLSGGSVTASNSSAFGTGPVTIAGSALQLRISDGRTIGNNITINGATGVSGQGLIQNTSTGNATLSGGTITINALPNAGGHFASASTGTLTIADAINSSVQIIVRIGTVIFSGAGSYNSIGAYAGTLRLGANNGLSTSATLSIGNSAAANFDLAGFSQSLVGLTKAGFGATVGNSSTTSDSTLTATGTSSFAGVIQDTLGAGTRKTAVTVNGGSLTLSGTNTYTGATAVKAGALIVSGSLSGSGTVTVGDAANLAASAVLTGTGPVGDVTVGAAVVNTGAAIDAGNGAASVDAGGVLTGNGVAGTLTTGAFSLTAGAHFSLQLGGATAGTQYDQLNATSLSLAGDLQGSLINGFTPTEGQVFFIAVQSGAGAAGAFSNAAQDSIVYLSGQAFQVTYLANWGGTDASSTFTDGNDVALMAVPEPGALVTLLGGMVTLFGFQRRRRA